jgi:hypothetical protein
VHLFKFEDFLNDMGNYSDENPEVLMIEYPATENDAVNYKNSGKSKILSSECYYGYCPMLDEPYGTDPSIQGGLKHDSGHEYSEIFSLKFPYEVDKNELSRLLNTFDIQSRIIHTDRPIIVVYLPSNIMYTYEEQKKKEFQGTGGMILTFSLEKQCELEKAREQFKFIVENLIESLLFFVNPLYSKFTSLEQLLKLKEESQRSAVASIMSHAYAHDIGSHALIHIAEDLSKLKDKIDKIKADELANFFEFLYSKGGFWAQITDISGNAFSGDIGTIKFLKNSINRQKEYLWKNLLLTELRTNENSSELSWKPEFQAKFKFKNKNDDLKFSSEICFPWGSNVGSQAFFTIIESIIRNLKHYLSGADIKNPGERESKSYDRKQEIRQNGINLEIGFDICPENKNLYRVSIWDGTTHETSDSWEIVNERLSLKEREIMYPSGEPKKCGISEMLICASILRGVDYFRLDKVKEPDLIHLDPCNNKQLKYIFYMWRGEEFKIIEDENKLNSYNKIEKENILDVPYRNKFILIPEHLKSQNFPKIRSGLLCETTQENHTATDSIWRVSKEKAFDPNNKISGDYVYESWVKHWLKLEQVSVKSFNENKHEIMIKYPLETIPREFIHGDAGAVAFLKYKSDRAIGQKLKKWYYSGELQKKIYRVVEAIETKILIVDERASDKMEHISEIHEVEAIDEAEKMGLYVLKPKSITDIKNRLKNLKRLHFFVIHTSLWEMICPNKNFSDELEQLKSNFLKNTYLFLTTGKSMPDWYNNQLKENYNNIPWYDIQAIFNTKEGEIGPNNNCRIYMIKEGLTNLFLNRGGKFE